MDESLIVILNEPVPALLLLSSEKEAFGWNGHEFQDVGIDTFFGFYDWLRTTDEKIIGVRMIFSAGEVDFLIPKLAKPQYVEWTLGSTAIEIFFTDEKTYSPSLSADQGFFGNRIYKSDDGTYAMSFGAKYVLDSLKSSNTIAPG